MKIGMLWYDNDPKADLGLKIERAASYYQNKYGRTPNLCFVHPSMLSPIGESAPVEEADKEHPAEKVNLRRGGIDVKPNRSVLPNHFWIGISAA